MLPLSEKVEVFNLIMKGKKLYNEVAKIYSKNKFSIQEIVKKENKFLLVLLSYLKLHKLQPECVMSA